MQQVASMGQGLSMRVVAAVFLIACLGAGCGSGTPEPASNVSMELKSNSFEDGKAIPDKYSSYGSNISPELSWTAPPVGTKSLVLLVEDPDAPRPLPFVHWLIYNISPTTYSIEEGRTPEEALVGKNDSGTAEYFGPKPPNGTHHYHFKIFAVDEPLNLASGASKEDVMKAINYHTLGHGEIIGLYSH